MTTTSEIFSEVLDNKARKIIYKKNFYTVPVFILVFDLRQVAPFSVWGGSRADSRERRPGRRDSSFV